MQKASPHWRLTDLLPHRLPMLLLEKVLHVDQCSSSSVTTIHQHSNFFVADQGVPSWVGLEYMGQTAALIAGFQQHQGKLAAHSGFLLGCRQFLAHAPWFRPNAILTISCQQVALVGNNLANFDCEIVARYPKSPADPDAAVPMANAVVSVFRQPARSTPVVDTRSLSENE